MKKIFIILLCLVLACVPFGCSDEEADLQRKVAEYRANKIATYIAQNEQYGDYEVDVVFLGDSLTDGYDLNAHYPQDTVLNRGIGGDTTFGLEERLQVSLYDTKPKVAVMLIGANNFKTMFDNYERILQGIKENVPNTEVIILSLTSMSGEWGKNNQIAAYNNVKIKMDYYRIRSENDEKFKTYFSYSFCCCSYCFSYYT